VTYAVHHPCPNPSHAENGLKSLKSSWRGDELTASSQRAAVEVMQERDFPVTLTALEKWESGERRPGKLTAQALLRFIDEHPRLSQEGGR
jgi:hypothetical protein